jgi:hypothetical protein
MTDSNAQDIIKKEIREAGLQATNDLRKAMYEQEYMNIRVLQIINGGAAVALVSLLGQVWTKAMWLIPCFTISIFFFIIGLVIAVLCGLKNPIFIEKRYIQNDTVDIQKEFKELHDSIMRFRMSSLLCFVIAVIIPIAVGFYKYIYA